MAHRQAHIVRRSVARRKALTLDEAMSEMAADPAIRREGLQLSVPSVSPW